MIRVAMVSFWHVHALDYARQALEHPETEIVAAWDEIPERGQAIAERLGIRYYSTLEELLASPDIDAVIVDTPTNVHRDVMVAAAQAGKHIFTEKVIASTLHEANEIVAAVEQAGVKLTVSLPRLNDRSTLAIQEILNRQLLGELTLVRTRLSHNGAIRTSEKPDGWLPEHFFNLEQCTGGALIDLGCHPMYLTRLFLGLPESVNANYGYITGREVEDNAVATLRYPQGAIGIVEAGFVNPHSPFTIEVHGTQGSLLFGTPDAKILIRSNIPEAESATEWSEYPQPAQRAPAFSQWVSHILNDTTASENIQIAIDLTMLMEAANLSALSNQSVSLESLTR